MLRHPYKKYERIFFYILSLSEMPAISDVDFIGGWSEAGTVMLFFHEENKRRLEEICRRYDCSVIYEADLDYNDWENGGEIRPFAVGGLVIAPLWFDGQADIRLDPSVIFGNGFHPTTRLCLEILTGVIDAEGGHVLSGLDLGCGTALLAIAMARKGVGRVLACDNNHFACHVARSNVRVNGFHPSIEVQEVDLTLKCPDTKVDLLSANLHHELLLTLFENPLFWQARYYVISGFFVHQEDVLLAALPTAKVRFLRREKRDKWGVWLLQGIEL